MTRGIEPVRKLAHLGYRFRLDGNTIKASYEGPGDPDPGQVQPLLETVKANEREAFILSSHSAPGAAAAVLCLIRGAGPVPILRLGPAGGTVPGFKGEALMTCSHRLNGDERKWKRLTAKNLGLA